ncbi:hypothetical protein C8R47DRAFT_1212603 [Mycena vitilis]|nr:hypothetical protein C8R47DRAFT_1212603 [Mycena vitilis]
MQNKKSLRKAESFAPFLHFSPLHEAHTQLWKTLLPLKPFRALTPADIANADPAFTTWETALDSITILAYDNANGDRPNTNLLLVDSILRFCDYGAGIPDIPGTDQTEMLRQRFVRLKCHIEKALLAEARSDERLAHLERSDAQCDLDLVRDWAIEIRQELLNPGQRTEHWSHDSLPWIFTYLAAWNDIGLSILIESGIMLVMRDIIHAPTIPVVSYMQPVRAWAASLLNRWKSRHETETMQPSENAFLGLDSDLSSAPPPSAVTCLVPRILYRIGEIANDFQELQDALTDSSSDHSRIFRALDKLEAWKAETEPLSAQCIRDSLSRFQITPGLRHSANEVVARVYSVMEAFPAHAHLERRVTSFSYHYPSNRDAATFQLTFRDKNAIPGAINSMGGIFGRETPDNRTWDDVSIVTNATDPINVLLSQFVSMANQRHRHPLAPLANFSIASTSEPFRSLAGKTNEEVQELQKHLWEVSPGRFVQGQVKDLPLTEGNIVYYKRGHFSRAANLELSTKQPQDRILPPSCVAPPHWVHPPMAPGGEDVWRSLPSLAFVGNGHDLYPCATSPPAIASHVYVPRSFERLGLYASAAYRQEVTKDSSPVKLEPPLTARQARGLLGKSIQYEVPVVPLPPLPLDARPKKKRREDPPPIHWGVVWGVDDSNPADIVLRIFSGGQHQEASATLTVGEPCEVPTNRVDTTLPFTPRWVGALALVDDVPKELELSAPEAGPDRLSEILKVAAKSPQFEVGIAGDCVILAGEIALHGIDSDSIERIENCKPGIWQGGRGVDDDKFLIWVSWVREGRIDLAQDAEKFMTKLEPTNIEGLAWTEMTIVSVDGGSMALLARGLTCPDAIRALTGNDDGDVESFVECVVLHGAEEGSFYIPGGVSSYTGGDGGFMVYVASDSDGKVVGVEILG